PKVAAKRFAGNSGARVRSIGGGSGSGRKRRRKRGSIEAEALGLPDYNGKIADEEYKRQQDEARKEAATRRDFTLANDLSERRSQTGKSSTTFRRRSQGGKLCPKQQLCRAMS
ncbi:unnamed protein product, partial [Pylaiella littoralis]